VKVRGAGREAGPPRCEPGPVHVLQVALSVQTLHGHVPMGTDQLALEALRVDSYPLLLHVMEDPAHGPGGHERINIRVPRR
jgi:hypothetical protein